MRHILPLYREEKNETTCISDHYVCVFGEILTRSSAFYINTLIKLSTNFELNSSKNVSCMLCLIWFGVHISSNWCITLNRNYQKTNKMPSSISWYFLKQWSKIVEILTASPATCSFFLKVTLKFVLSIFGHFLLTFTSFIL